MKTFKIFAILNILLYSFGVSFSQTGWISQASNTTKNLYGIFFVSQSTGFAIGDSSIILKTTDSGANWLILPSPVQAAFKDIHFINMNTGYISGLSGTIIKTTNSGQNWINIGIADTINWNAIFFISDTGWVSGTSGKIIKTTNGGNNWAAQNSNASAYQFDGIYFLNTSSGFVCGGQHLPWPSNRIVDKTTNGGTSWSAGVTSQVSAFVKIQFPNQVTGWTVGYTPGDSGCVSRSTDGGGAWSYRTPISPGVRLNSEFWFNGDSGYVVGNNGTIFKTTNGITGFSRDTSGTTYNLTDIAYSGNSLYAVGEHGKILKKNLIFLAAKLNSVYRPNCGRISKENITLSDSLCTGIIDSVFWYINNQLISTQHTMTFSFPQGTTQVVLRTKNHIGNNDSATAFVVRSVYKIYTSGSIAGSSLIGDSVLYTVSGNVVYRTDINGNTIYPFSPSGNIPSPCSIGYDTSIFFASSDNSLYGVSKNATVLWPPVPLGAVCNSTPAIDSIHNRLYTGVSNSNFMAINKSTGSIAWSYFADAPIKSSAVISSDGKLIFVSSKGTIYGFKLATISTPPVPDWILSLNDSVFVSPAIDESGYVYVGTKGGKLIKVLLPSSGQASAVWQFNLGSPATSSPVIDADGHIYLGTANGNLYSVKYDGSLFWNYSSQGAIKSTPVITNTPAIYFGNDAGEFIGLDINKNRKFYYLDSAKISCPILYKSGTLYLGTESGRMLAFYDSAEMRNECGTGLTANIPVWGTFQKNARRTGNQIDGNPIGIINHNINIISEFRLYQNYPNPFNPETRISFQINKMSDVKLEIYDILGREVSMLLNKKLMPGYYSVDWSAGGMPSGIYFCRINAGDFIENKRMVLIK
jgi:photosystem II stability/assembly factor-like uncharacterized protein